MMEEVKKKMKILVNEEDGDENMQNNYCKLTKNRYDNIYYLGKRFAI